MTQVRCCYQGEFSAVAPLAGARVETPMATPTASSPTSRPSRARGLKLHGCAEAYAEREVAPLAGARVETSAA